jgi:uncharacterized membrane protein YgdD (TMEM256/DUF423 family)
MWSNGLCSKIDAKGGLMQTKWIWASLAIVSMWVAVLFTAIWAPSLEATSSNGDSTTVPAAVAVSLFAAIATIVVAVIGFRGETHVARRVEPEQAPEPTPSPSA